MKRATLSSTISRWSVKKWIKCSEAIEKERERKRERVTERERERERQRERERYFKIR